ncbi:Predicted arabinose efflux permease, MFS family [Pseudonocardia thermophila]|uniref:Predicted arabinose efflux permease, MFS family n=1 Tax=Pseudonocardia thermophila TaxID=1848 RepID=A0A1M6T8M1_PSETH|nr:Predicted arabinose efflux permease, MFS family [Pseudonocardia thermophila]
MAGPRAVVAVSTLATGLGAFLGFVPGFLAPVLQADLDLSRTELGVLIGVFYGSTGVSAPLAGRLTDRMGARRAVTLDLVLIAAALVTAAVWPVYPVLLVGALAAGFGYALTNAGTNLAVAVAVPAHRHGISLATKTAGVPLLVAVSAPIATAAGEAVGWRPVYLGAVPLVLLTAAGAAWALPSARPTGAPGRSADAAPRRLPRGFLWYPIAAFLLVGGSQPLYSWMVAYLNEAGDTPLALAGALTSLGSVAGVAGMVLAAQLSDRGTSRSTATGNPRIPGVVAMCLATAAGMVLLLAGPVTGLVPMVAGLLLATAAQLAAIGIMHASVVAAAPHAVGRASGATMAGYYVGALLGAPVFGAVVDATGGYTAGWAMSLVLVLGGTAAFSRCRRVGFTSTTASSPNPTSGSAAAADEPAPPDPRSDAAAPPPHRDPPAGG